MQPRAAYHHGDLREALIAASFDLIAEKGAENFLLSDACRLAGVSTAAPYKHFRDRDEILESVVARAFDEMTEKAMLAIHDNGGPGTLTGITEMGRCYVKFAIERQALFRLMFGQNPNLKAAATVTAHGRSCFGQVIEQVALYCQAQSIPGDPINIAVRLWTFVHGAASLMIDEDYEAAVPGFAVEPMIAEATALLLSPAPHRDDAN